MWFKKKDDIVSKERIEQIRREEEAEHNRRKEQIESQLKTGQTINYLGISMTIISYYRPCVMFEQTFSYGINVQWLDSNLHVQDLFIKDDTLIALGIIKKYE